MWHQIPKMLESHPDPLGTDKLTGHQNCTTKLYSTDFSSSGVPQESCNQYRPLCLGPVGWHDSVPNGRNPPCACTLPAQGRIHLPGPVLGGRETHPGPSFLSWVSSPTGCAPSWSGGWAAELQTKSPELLGNTQLGNPGPFTTSASSADPSKTCVRLQLRQHIQR